MKSKLNSIPPMIYIDYYNKDEKTMTKKASQFPRNRVKTKPNLPTLKTSNDLKKDHQSDRIIYYYNNENNISKYLNKIQHLKIKPHHKKSNSTIKNRNIDNIYIDDLNSLINPLKIESLSSKKNNKKQQKMNNSYKMPIIIDKYFSIKNNREMYNKLLNINNCNNRYDKPIINLEDVIINQNANKTHYNQEDRKVKSYYFKQSLLLMNSDYLNNYKLDSYLKTKETESTKSNKLYSDSIRQLRNGK